MPDKPDLVAPEPGAIEAVVAAVAERTIAPPAPERLDGPLVTDLPAPGEIVSETQNAELGTTEWVLDNGLTVLLKPTPFRSDNLVFVGTSWGGLSLASDADYVAAATAAEIVAEVHRAVREFRQGERQEDDVTVVVCKRVTSDADGCH